MAAAIDTIAELGTSKGVIIYHFGGKDELIRELAAELVARGAAYMRPRIEAEQTGMGMLRAYIESNLAFMAENRNHVVATVEIALNARAADGSRLFSWAFQDRSVASARELLVHFQRTGEFRAGFDPLVMARAIRAGIDNVASLLVADPGLDIAHHARELADLFVRAASPPAARHQSLEE